MGGHAGLRGMLFPAGYFAANAVYQGYISLYYTRLGFHSGQLGAISAATAAAALAAQPLWGRLADRIAGRKRLLAVLSLAAAVSLPFALAGRGFVLQLGAAVLFYAFFCALLPLGDAILLDQRDLNFGTCRLAGGLSFALAGALFGLARGRMGGGAAVWCAAGLLTLAAGAALLMPDAPVRRQRQQGGMRALLKDRQLVRMLIFVLPLQMSMGYFYTFFAPRFSALPGGTSGLLGLGYLISAASEAPYLICSGRIYRRFGAAGPMRLAALALTARWVLLGAAGNAWMALAGQLLHGAGFIVVSVSMARWIAGHVPPEQRASGQMLLNMLCFGVARAAGNLLGGLLARNLGMAAGFYACAGLCAAAALLGPGRKKGK